MGNSLKTIYARLTNNASAVGALQALGISINDVEGNVKSSSAVLSELAGIWDTLSDAQRQSTSVNVAGIYQLSRFNALMNNYDIALQATTTSLNSYGSAAREQEKYNQSLEARINRLSTAWYGFADAVGNTVVYDSIVVATSALQKLTETSSTFGGTSIGLASAVGLLAAPISLVSGRFTAFTGSIIQNTAQQKLAGASATTLTGRLYSLAAGATAASTAFRTLLIATGVGVALAGVTLGLTYLINKLSEAKQETEQYDTYIKNNVLALTENREEVQKLLEKFNELSNQRQNDKSFDSTKEQEYIDVQNQLAQLFPGIIDHVDARGNASIKSSEAIQKEVEATNKLIEADNKLKQATAVDSFSDLSDAIEDQEKKLAGLNKVLDLFNKKGYSNERIAETEYEIAKLEKSISDNSAEIRANVGDLADSFGELGDDANKAISGELNRAFNSLDFSKLEPEKLKEFAKAFSELRAELSEAFNNDNADEVERITEELNNLFATTSNYNPELSNLSLNFDKLKESSLELPDLIQSTDESLAGIGSTSEEVAKNISDLAESVEKFKTVEEQLAGVSQNAVDSGQDLLFQYQQLTSQLGGLSDAQLRDLSQKNRLTVEEKAVVQALIERQEVLQLLAVVYPELAVLQGEAISLSEKQTKAIEQEQHANEVLLEAYKASSEGKLTYEQAQTVNQAKETKNRINIIKTEIASLNSLIAQYESASYKALSTAEFVKKSMNGELQSHSSSFVLPDANGSLTTQVKKQLASANAELEAEQNSLNKYITSLDSILTSVGASSKSTKSSKASTKATTESIYVTDKYKQAIEALNVALTKQQKLQNDYPQYTDKYRASVQAEIKLQQQKLELIEAQTKALQSQIASGKIAQTGNVSISKGTTKTTVNAGSTSVSGFQGRLTSPQGWRTNPVTGLRQYHEGIDIANPKGTRLDSHVDGTVLKTGNNAISGNYVKVKDVSGITHFFGHLDTIVAKMGDVITAGTKIGTIGSTGRSTGSHLHYQVSDANGKLLDAATYAKQARTGTVTTKGGTTTTSSGAVSNSTQSIDEAKSALSGLQEEIVSQQELIQQLEESIIDSFRAYYANKQEVLETDFELQESRLALTNRSDAKYNKILDYQLSVLGKKLKYQQEDLTYNNEILRKGKASELVLAETRDRIQELETSIRQLNLEIQQFNFNRIINDYETSISLAESLTKVEQNRLAVLNTDSPVYRKTLELINKEYRDQKVATESLILSLNTLINSGKLTGQTFLDATNQLKEARASLLDLEAQISSGNYDIIVNIQTNFSNQIDDLDFLIQREQLFRANYTKGSANYQDSIAKETALLQQQADAQLALYEAQEKELKNLSLTSEDYKQVTESLEDAELQYYSLINAIKDLNKESEESSLELLEDIADQAIQALKDYYSQRQEESNKDYDDRLEQEQKLHDQIIKNYEEEIDLFRKNVEERLRLIDREENERDYNIEINDLESERRDVADQINLLSLDDSREAKKKRKDLQEQLDKIDRDIAERRHDRDIELQKQALSDQLEQKEEDITEQQELENERYDNLVQVLEDEKEYYNQYYTDLLNDERKFAEIREKIVKGNLAEVRAEFEKYAIDLESTAYKLENTLNGTMEAVGTAIRFNVIDNLREALSLIDEFTTAQDSNSTVNTDSLITSPRDPNSGKSTLTNGGNSNTSTVDSANTSAKNALTSADYKVLFAKYLAEYSVRVAKNQNTIDNLKVKASSLAQQGRSQGSVISSDISLNQAMANLDNNQRGELKTYINGNASKYVSSDYLLSDVLKFAASLDTGGKMNFSGSGIDGKGGKAIIAHPNEIILNTKEVDTLFQSMQVSDSLSKSLLAITSRFGNILNNATSPISSSGEVNNTFQITGDIYTENKDSVQNFFSEVGNMMKTQNGGY